MTTGSGEVIFGVVGILEIARLSDDEVPRCVIRIADNLVLGAHGDAQALLRATSIS